MTKKKIIGLFYWILGISLSASGQTEIDTLFTSSNEEFLMSATVTVPNEGGIKAAVVLLSVAGPTDKDMSLGNHQYFRDLAHGLAAQGIASLRYDDRGVGRSEGDWKTTTMEDRTLDACQARAFLSRMFPGVDYLGFIGMSEGAGIAALTTESCPEASFVVMLSLPARSGRTEIESQMSRLLEFSFFSDLQKQDIQKEAERFLGFAGDTDPERNRDSILHLLRGKYGSVILPPYHFVPTDPEEKTDFILSPWYQSQLNYNVQSALTKMYIPGLAIYGTLDLAIDPAANEEALKALNPRTEVYTLEGINHLMQEANTGSPMEYAYLPTAFSPVVIEKIAAWIAKL